MMVDGNSAGEDKGKQQVNDAYDGQRHLPAHHCSLRAAAAGQTDNPLPPQDACDRRHVAWPISFRMSGSAKSSSSWSESPPFRGMFGCWLLGLNLKSWRHVCAVRSDTLTCSTGRLARFTERIVAGATSRVHRNEARRARDSATVGFQQCLGGRSECCADRSCAVSSILGDRGFASLVASAVRQQSRTGARRGPLSRCRIVHRRDQAVCSAAR